MQPSLDLTDVTVVRSGVTILDRVTLRVDAGEVVGVAGPNGTGKTTLLRVAATLLVPDAGSARVLGELAGSPAGRRIRPRIGLVGHQPALSPTLTLTENLAFTAALAGVSTERVARTLTAVGLAGAADRRAQRVSAGMARRADMARVLLLEPDLLLLDEPDAALDRDATTLVDALVSRTIRRGGAVLTVSHDPARMRQLCDRVVTLRDGRVEAA